MLRPPLWIWTRLISVVDDLQQSGARIGSECPRVPSGNEARRRDAVLSQLVAAGLLEAVATSMRSPRRTRRTGPRPDLVAAAACRVVAAVTRASCFPLHQPASQRAGGDCRHGSDKAIVAFAFARARLGRRCDAPGAFTTPIVNNIATQPADLGAAACARLRPRAPRGAFQRSAGSKAADCWFIAQYPALFGVASIQSLANRRSRRDSQMSPAAHGKHVHEWLSCKTFLWQYHVRANGNQPLMPAPLFGGDGDTGADLPAVRWNHPITRR